MKGFIIFLILILCLELGNNQTQGSNSLDKTLIHEYFKYKINEAIDYSIVTPVKENDLSYSIKAKKKIDNPTSIMSIKRNDIYSTSTIYPFFDKIILGLMDFFQIPSRPNMIKDNIGNSQINFYSLQWVYQMLFFKYSSQYYGSQIQIDSAFAPFMEVEYSLSAKFVSASVEDIEFINFAIEYGKNIASPLVLDSDDKLNHILDKFNLRIEQYFHLLEAHSYIQQFFSNRFPDSGFEFFINNETMDEFKYLLVYILNEGLLYNTSSILSLCSKVDSFLVNEYLKLVDPESKLTLFALWTSPSLQAIRKVPVYFNFSYQDIKGEVEEDSFKIYLSEYKKDQEIKIENYDQTSLDEVYYKGNTNIFTYSQHLIYKKSLTLSLKELISEEKYKTFKYLLPVSVQLSDTAIFILNTIEVDFSLLAYLRLSLVKSNIDHKVIQLHLLQTQKLLNYQNETKALLKYSEVIEAELSKKEVTGKLSSLIGDLLILDRFKAKLNLENNKIILLQNSYMMMIFNRIIENKQKLMILNRLKDKVLKERIREIKQKIIN